MYTRRINFSPDGDGEGGQPTVIDFAANESAAIEYFKSKGFVVETTEGIQNKFVSPAVQKTHSDWEATAAEALGEAKPAGEKGLNWIKKAVADKVKKADETPTAEPEKPAGTTKVSEEVSKAELKALQDKLDEFQRDKTAGEKALEQKTINTNLKVVLKGVKFNAESDDEEAARRATAETLIKAKYGLKLDEEGDLVLYNAEGPVIDPETGKAITVEKVIKKEYGFMISAEKKAPIGGTGTTKETVVTRQVDGVEAIVASSVKDLREKLLAKALIPGDKKYNDIFHASCKTSGLDPLGM